MPAFALFSVAFSAGWRSKSLISAWNTMKLTRREDTIPMSSHTLKNSMLEISLFVRTRDFFITMRRVENQAKKSEMRRRPRQRARTNIPIRIATTPTMSVRTRAADVIISSIFQFKDLFFLIIFSFFFTFFTFFYNNIHKEFNRVGYYGQNKKKK